jgi:hypothetical protein
MEVLGKIIVIGKEEIVGTAGTFKKRQLVVETDEQYPQKVGIDFVQDKCSILDKYVIGDSVKVGINIRGNEYNSKYYVSLNGWRIEKLDNTNKINVESIPAQPFAPATNFKEEEHDDLPF